MFIIVGYELKTSDLRYTVFSKMDRAERALIRLCDHKYGKNSWSATKTQRVGCSVIVFGVRVFDESGNHIVNYDFQIMPVQKG